MKDPLSLYTTEEYNDIHNKPVTHFPKMLIMQASSFCNYTCLQCPRQIKVDRRKITGLGEGFLEVDLVQKVANEFKSEDSFLGVLFALYGEPLANKNIVEFVRIVKNSGKNVQITTNASYLDEQMAHSLIGAGIDKIKISFQGATKEEYSFWRDNQYYDKIISNIEKLILIREKLKSRLYIQIGTSVANDTDEQIEEFVNYWRSRVDNVYYEPTGVLHIQDKDYIKDKTFKHQAVQRTYPCFDIFTRMSVLYNGQVPLCVDDEEHNMGNLYEQTITEIWNGEKFQNNRKIILEKGNVLEPCKYCYTAPRGK